MKRFLVILILALSFTGKTWAINQDSATLELRKKAYMHYRMLNDTTTIRTWVNIHRLNKALLVVVAYDNQLLKSYSYKDSVSRADSHLNPDTATHLQLLKDTEPFVSNLKFNRKYLLAAIAACGLFVIVLLMLLIIRSIGMRQVRRTLDEREETIRNQIIRMEFLETEVKEMKNREKEIKAELEIGIVNYQMKMQQLRLRINELADENTRIKSLLAPHPSGSYAEESSLSGETVAIKHELIDKLESMLSRLKEMNL